MLDLKFIRSETDRVRRGLEAKNAGQKLDRLLAVDEERRRLLQQVEIKKAARNKSSQEIGRLKSEGGDTAAQQEEMRALSDEIKALDGQVRQVEEEMEQLLSWMPNLPHDSAPVGADASANLEVRRWGTLPPESFRPLPHWEIGERLGLFDFKKAARLSGSGFSVFTGPGARLQRALIQFMLDFHTRRHGFLEVSTPYLVRRECMFGTGQLPKMEEDMYRCEVDDLFLIPTAEVPITNLYREETIQEVDLPIRLVGYSPCFRREAGAYGKETRGMIRVHQFDKVEMVKIVRPETSYDEHESLTKCAEAVLQALDLPYRVLSLATGDLSFAAAKCYDLEAWSPAEGRWLEVSSCSNFEAFQARRIGLRYRTAEGKLEYPHTLNGSGLALPRIVVAILEMYQTDRGTIRVPEVLRPYMDGLEELGPETNR
jgi:seryl-tRNA synthetase